MKLSDSVKEKIAALVPRYADPRGAAIPALELAQGECGHVTPDLCEQIGALLGVPGVKIWETATFYTMFRKAPEGRFRIGVCRSVACDLARSAELIAHFKAVLRVDEGETTPDGLFVLHTAECLGACGTAPVLTVNDTEYHEAMTPAKADALLADLRRRAGEAGGV